MYYDASWFEIKNTVGDERLDCLIKVGSGSAAAKINKDTLLTAWCNRRIKEKKELIIAQRVSATEKSSVQLSEFDYVEVRENEKCVCVVGGEKKTYTPNIYRINENYKSLMTLYFVTSAPIEIVFGVSYRRKIYTKDKINVGFSGTISLKISNLDAFYRTMFSEADTDIITTQELRDRIREKIIEVAATKFPKEYTYDFLLTNRDKVSKSILLSGLRVYLLTMGLFVSNLVITNYKKAPEKSETVESSDNNKD